MQGFSTCGFVRMNRVSGRGRHCLTRGLFGYGSSNLLSPMSSRSLSTRQPFRYEVFDWFRYEFVPRWRRIALVYKGAAVLVGSSLVYYTVHERGAIATTDSIVSTFEASNADWLNSHFSKDLLASVKRPLLEEDLGKLLHPDISNHYAVVIGASGTGKSTAIRLAVRSLSDPKGIVYFLTPEVLEYFSTELAEQVGYRGSTTSADPPYCGSRATCLVETPA